MGTRLVPLVSVLCRSLLAVLLFPVLVLASLPRFQRLLVYLHWVNFPSKDLSDPVKWGYRAHTARSLFIVTADHVRLGAWHLISPPSTSPHELNHLHRPSHDLQQQQHWKVKNGELVYLYFHGNAGNRASQYRRAFYQTLFTAHMRSARGGPRARVHVLAIDYRGFGDSSSVLPSEKGLLMDAIAAWDYVVRDLHASPDQVVIVGHSMGTAVASALASLHLGASNQVPRGLLLVAPFTSIPDTAFDYPYVPLWLFSPIQSWLKPMLCEKWPNIEFIANMNCDTLIIHGTDDWIVPYHHSRSLFGKGTGHTLPKSGALSVSDLSETLIVTSVSNEGAVLRANFSSTNYALTFAEIFAGGHDDLHEYAIARDVIANWLVSTQNVISTLN